MDDMLRLAAIAQLRYLRSLLATRSPNYKTIPLTKMAISTFEAFASAPMANTWQLVLKISR